eukprot:TRINITY_DN3_c0_g2_i1.p1 TRINITY_DN3_c0_g2~~TRINITY_DN3_c0_g2_i1.p1  ORF type:complete len:376 (+),score=49.97 TRINITY_DN3_c0_g2_i1:83-1210(+)
MRCDRRVALCLAFLPVASALLLAAPQKQAQANNSAANITAASSPSSDVTTVATASTKAGKDGRGWTFAGWYNAYAQGRGIWKWSNALDAYQRHFAAFVGKPIHLAEVGVQSGGSITMWKSVLGAQCHVYGLDINPESLKFQDPTTTIVIGDQENPQMWKNFYANTVKSPLTILVDDGGHTPGQMLVTLQQTFPMLTPDGTIAIEDIHGVHYVNSFFTPAADFLAVQATQGKLSSVHVYPFLLVASREQAPATPLPGASKLANSLSNIWDIVPHHPGGHIIFPNPGTMPFLGAAFMKQIFAHFGNLHGGSWTSTPKGCQSTAAAVCTVQVTNTPMQATIVGVHIYSDRLVVDVAGDPPVIAAVRRGTEWVTSSVER